MTGSKVVRLLIALIAGILIAGALSLQSASSFLARQQPALAAQLMPMNGSAFEQRAASEFTSGVKEVADIMPSALAAASTAHSAFRNDPLSPKAHAVLALAESDPVAKRGILEAATRLNRRDLLLQGLVLEGQVERKDYPGTLETLDAIMRVHPEQKANFFPILTRALSDSAALPALAGILDRDTDWQEDFLKYAARKPDALSNLAKLRLARDDVDPEIDERLIKGLVSSGSAGDAHQIYLKSTRNTQSGATSHWHSALPPFDWSLANEAGFRAQPAPNSNALEVFVRSGKGGVLAEKLILNPRTSFPITISHALLPAAQIKDVRWLFSCANSQEPFYEREFRIRTDKFTVPAAPQACDFIRVAIRARSWSGSPSIRGTIDRLELKTPAQAGK